VGLYNFHPRFVPFIEIGLRDPHNPRAKTHTIRAPRAREDRPGSTMHLYVGLRRKGARRIEARVGDPPPTCVRVETIVIWGSELPHHESVWTPSNDATLREKVWIGPLVHDAQPYCVIHEPAKHGLVCLTDDECQSLARRDGFGDFPEMMQFWTGRLPFYGHIFHWR